MILDALLHREPEIVVALPASDRVGDFAVRAVASSGRTGGVACGGARGEGREPFAVMAGPILSAGWRWARTWHPHLYRRYHGPVSPLELWAALELEAGSAVHHAAMRDVERAKGRHMPPDDLAWRRADRLQQQAMRMWLSEPVQVVVRCTGLALVLALYLEGERRVAAYVEGR